jgi:hypothetical protein
MPLRACTSTAAVLPSGPYITGPRDQTASFIAIPLRMVCYGRSVRSHVSCSVQPVVGRETPMDTDRTFSKRTVTRFSRDRPRDRSGPRGPLTPPGPSRARRPAVPRDSDARALRDHAGPWARSRPPSRSWVRGRRCLGCAGAGRSARVAADWGMPRPERDIDSDPGGPSPGRRGVPRPAVPVGRTRRRAACATVSRAQGTCRDPGPQAGREPWARRREVVRTRPARRSRPGVPAGPVGPAGGPPRSMRESPGRAAARAESPAARDGQGSEGRAAGDGESHPPGTRIALVQDDV